MPALPPKVLKRIYELAANCLLLAQAAAGPQLTIKAAAQNDPSCWQRIGLLDMNPAAYMEFIATAMNVCLKARDSRANR